MNPSWLIQPSPILIPNGKSIAGDLLEADGVIDSQLWPVMTWVNGQRASNCGQRNQQVLRFEP